MEDQLKAQMEGTYNTKVTCVTKLDEGVYKFERENDKTWVVRIFREGYDAKRDAEVLSFLKERGFQAEVLAHENALSTLDGRCVLITDFIEGISPLVQNEHNLYRLGKMLGLLSTLPLPEGLAKHLSGALHHYVNGGEIKREFLIALDWMSEVESKIPSHRKPQFEILRDKLIKADDLSDLTKALIHPDPVLKNVVCTQNNDLLLIDWANSGFGPRILPLAVLLFTGSLEKNGGFSTKFVEAIVSGYRTHVNLEKNELERLKNAMEIRPLIFACFRYKYAVSTVGRIPSGKEWWWISDELVNHISEHAINVFKADLQTVSKFES